MAQFTKRPLVPEPSRQERTTVQCGPSPRPWLRQLRFPLQDEGNVSGRESGPVDGNSLGTEHDAGTYRARTLGIWNDSLASL